MQKPEGPRSPGQSPGLGRRDQGDRSAGLEIHAKIAGTVEIAARVVAAARLDLVTHVGEVIAGNRECWSRARDLKAQRREARSRQLVAIALDAHRIRLIDVALEN